MIAFFMGIIQKLISDDIFLIYWYRTPIIMIKSICILDNAKREPLD